ncbi:uncharacterized protein C8R40DRAFT_1071503 [Lentinula edodes]|uniref:uncharacterized protein n=1 Tax=Lentinula edodes TaxID=5353 RepID=UPI001E8EC8C8|nr:uncharacterized protein C8R40DRAFT_1071503 [Lentinula edodes]KAH7872872.1 hypothetical protein C8R40DRAFT_1071503 [Lentinula edodes]
MTRNSAEEQAHAIVLLYNSGHVIAVISQTFVYGIYTVLIPVSSYVMLRRGLATRAQKILFGMTIFMFALLTTHWIASIATLIRLIHVAQSLNHVDGTKTLKMCLFMLSLIVVSVIATIASHITLMVIDTKETGELGSGNTGIVPSHKLAGNIFYFLEGLMGQWAVGTQLAVTWRKIGPAMVVLRDIGMVIKGFGELSVLSV